MAKMCPKCGRMNDDEMVFCVACTEPLNDDVKLVMRVEEMVKEHKHTDRPAERPVQREEAPKGARTEQETEAKGVQKKAEKEGGSALPMILLGIVAAVAVVFLLK